jgi:hypothetical protein
MREQDPEAIQGLMGIMINLTHMHADLKTFINFSEPMIDPYKTY